MEKPTHVDNESAEILLKVAMIALVVCCMGVIKAVKGNGDSSNFPGRVKWLALHTLRTLPRVFSRSSESIISNKRRYDKVASMFSDIWDEIFNVKPQRRKGEEDNV